MKKQTLIGFWAFVLCFASGEVLGQYAFNPQPTNENVISVTSEIFMIHKDAPDKFINKTDVEITIEIRDSRGNKFKGLQRDSTSNPSDLTDKLPAGEERWINHAQLRRGTGAENKVELILTIPGVKNANDEWDLKQVKWNLGEEHDPSYTKLNYLGRQEGYQIIFVYDNGLEPREHEESEEHRENHVDGHVCDPDDQFCGG